MYIYGWNTRHAILHPWKCIIVETYEQIKAFIQRGSRGYSDRDVWSLCSYLNEWLPKALKDLQSQKTGYPIGMKCRCEWDKTLQKIIDGMESNRKWMELDFDFKGNAGKKIEMNLRKKSKEGLELFVKYFNNLWD